MPGSHQLAVIMFADVVGYTAMMQQDETLALQKLNRFKDVLQRGVKQQSGELIQYYGDGALVIFNNSGAAVTCAIALQEEFREEPRIPVRIGLHLGDILYKEGNIFGDCVNIASRIEGMSIPGAVLISGVVQKQIKNRPEFKLAHLGSFDFKNVDESIDIFALATGNLPIPGRDELMGKFKQKQVKSIAVLPFVNMSNDPEQEYFSDGIAEEIINSLAHLKDLNVPGRTSSFQFKGRNTDLREIGEKLQVKTVLEGSVRKQGNKLRITVQLINVQDGFHVWSERFDREMIDVFAIQDEIALTITEKLRVILRENDRDQIVKSHTRNAEAYELYLKGKFYVGRRGPSIIKGIQSFRQAIELDSVFALAHAGYAEANLLMATYGLVQPEPAMVAAKVSAETAIQIDPELSQAYCSLGYYYTCYEWDWPKAKQNFLRSLELNPKYAEGHFRYGWNYLTCVEGNFIEAEQHALKAIELEPLSSICFANYSLILHSAGKFNEALEASRTGLELDAYSFVSLLNQGMAQLALQQSEEAIATYELAIKLSNRHHFLVNALIWAYCITGKLEQARTLMEELRVRARSEYITPTFAGLSAAYLGELDESFEYLEKAVHDHDPILLMIKYENWVPDKLRNDSRFKKILETIGFPNEDIRSERLSIYSK